MVNYYDECFIAIIVRGIRTMLNRWKGCGERARARRPVCRGRLMAVIRLMGAKIPADFNSEDGMGARARPPPCARARRREDSRRRSNERTLEIQLCLHLSRGAK